jgi:transcriptional repressor NrdR
VKRVLFGLFGSHQDEIESEFTRIAKQSWGWPAAVKGAAGGKLTNPKKEDISMKCPFCNAEDTKVIDSRPADNSIRRRRQCEVCGKRFTTYEKVETIPLMIIKKGDRREPYDRAKLEDGVMRACHKRPISVDTVSAMIDEIENEIMGREEKEIPSSEVGEIVMEHLRRLDDVAYVRFASVYKEFKDVDTFLREIEKVAKKKN